MSMSTGDMRQPPGKQSAKAVATDGKKPDAKASKTASAAAAKGDPAKAGGATAKAKPAARLTGGKPVTKAASGGKGRKPMAPVKVNQTFNWGPVVMFGGAGLVALLIVGFAAYSLISRPDPSKWQERAEAIPGISVFLKSNPDWFVTPAEGNHKPGPLTYPSTPPVGGTHNGRWQSCMGDVYPAEIPKEQAVHSMEHGAVWITYRPDLPADQVDKLAERVDGNEFLMMSPFPGQDKPIALQAWGYQLKVDDANDGRIDDFINELRRNATQEPQAGCQGGITDTGTVPLDLPN